jgi:hypothetical protein
VYNLASLSDPVSLCVRTGEVAVSTELFVFDPNPAPAQSRETTEAPPSCFKLLRFLLFRIFRRKFVAWCSASVLRPCTFWSHVTHPLSRLTVRPARSLLFNRPFVREPLHFCRPFAHSPSARIALSILGSSVRLSVDCCLLVVRYPVRHPHPSVLFRLIGVSALHRQGIFELTQKGFVVLPPRRVVFSAL